MKALKTKIIVSNPDISASQKGWGEPIKSEYEHIQNTNVGKLGYKNGKWYYTETGKEYKQLWSSGGENLVQTLTNGSTSYNPNYEYVVGEINTVPYSTEPVTSSPPYTFTELISGKFSRIRF